MNRWTRKRCLTVPRPLIYAIYPDILLHFFNLQNHEAGVWISIAVILGKEVEGFVISPVGDKPSGAFGDEPDGEHDNDTGESLQDERDSPCPMALNALRSEHDGSRRDRSTEPSAVVET